MKNKQGKTSAGLNLLIVLGVLIIGFLAYSQVTQSIGQENLGEQIATEQGCSVNPTIVTSVSDALTGGTATSVDVTARVNGAFVGGVPASLEKGSKVELLFNASNYISDATEEFTVGCGVNSKHMNLYATDDVTVQIKTSAGTVAGNCLSATATCAGVNQSSFTTVEYLEMKLTAPSQKATGDLIVVIEADNATELADFTFSGAGAKDGVRPSSKTFSQNNTNSLVEVYEVPSLQDGAFAVYNIGMTPGVGKTVSGTIIYVTVYSKQDFLDSDGTFAYGVENKDHSATKYEDTQIVGVNTI